MILKTSSVTISLLLLLATCIVGWVVVPWFIKWQVKEKFVLSPEYNAELFSAWIHPPMPIYFKVYLFNVTNPGGVEKGKLPLFSQVGPYVFLENRTKIELVTDEDADTLSYKEYIAYHFRPELSANLSLEDRMTILNVPFVAAAMKISHDLPWPMNDIARMVLLQKENIEPLFVEKRVEEILFKGWSVPFLQKIDDQLGFSLLPDNNFAYFMKENDTAKGPFTVSRGVNDRSSFGQVVRFENRSELKTWKEATHCNRIQGTDGSLFTPFVEKESVLHFFNPQFCQSVYATFERESEVDGVRAYRFSAPQQMIEDPRKSDENRCYCVHIDDEPEKCLKRGAMDLGPCREGAPVAVTPPHFLDSHPDYLHSSSLTPNRTKHSAFMEIEPVTGVILQGSSKLQINLMLKPVKGISSLKKVPEMLFPLFWADECAKLDEVTLSRLRSVLHLLWLGEFLLKWVLPGVVLLASVLVTTKGAQRSKKLLHKATLPSQLLPIQTLHPHPHRPHTKHNLQTIVYRQPE